MLPLSTREEAVSVLYVSGSPVDEIAAAVGLSAGTVTSYLERARVKFQNAGRSASDR